MHNCPTCNAEVDVPADAIQGEIVPCGECAAELEVLTLEPVALGIAPEVQEDWGE